MVNGKNAMITCNNKLTSALLFEKFNVPTPRTAFISNEKNIDHQRLREAVKDDLLRDKLLAWLEENSTITELDSNKETKPAKSPSKRKNPNSKSSQD